MPYKLGNVTRRTAEALKPRDWEFIESMPLWIDLPSHGVRVVHAGVLPRVPIEQQAPRTLMYLRSLGNDGTEPLELRGDRSWAQSYPGPDHVVFGHNAQLEPEIAPFATGLDTGAVYGGRLTAMVLREGERPPAPEERRSVLVSVPSRRVYFTKTKRGPGQGPGSDPGSNPGSSPGSGVQGGSGTIRHSPFLRRAS